VVSAMAATKAKSSSSAPLTKRYWERLATPFGARSGSGCRGAALGRATG
jgi:hypothetical protein